ncbi:MAG: hypothetical protein H7X93_10095 [Sphingomonadaceae bacterium]|nr:hypothetical protein [Sphingomonadaceae bacterium]
MQRLHIAGVIDRLHYLSTVSGGGYTGASLTWFLTQKANGGRRFGTGPENFPFCGGDAAGERNAVETPRLRTAAPVDGRAVLDYIRQRSSYLNPGAGFTMISASAIMLRSVLTSILAFTLLIAVVLTPLLQYKIFDLPAERFGLSLPAPFGHVDKLTWPTLIAAGLLLLLGLSIVIYSLVSGLPQVAERAYAWRRGYQIAAGRVLATALALLLLGLLAETIEYVSVRGLPLTGKDSVAFGGASTALGAIGGLAARAARVVPSGIVKRAIMTVLPPAALLLLVTGLGFLGHALALRAIGYGTAGIAGLMVGTAIYCIWTNINLTGLHRFYRDRLMESFMPDPGGIKDDEQAASTSADECYLADCCRKEDDGPYHLINTNIVLLGAGKARFRSRGGDSFVLSPLFCGSEATGFIETRRWLPGPARLAITRRHGSLALPTAMAISGAALNPRAGGDGKGPTKGGAISALLNLLNLRLGYWLPSPRKIDQGGAMLAYRAAPNFILPGLFQGLFGFRHNEEAHWLELSDGGHFENTGIYELVRRRVPTIVFADGSTDPEIALASFANALEKIYIDFNVTVTFDETADFTRMMRGMDSIKDVLSERLNFSDAGFAIGTIHYRATADRPACEGKLFYVKSTMVRKLPTALYSYKASNPLFPAESLADQFFSEQQFEAYRALGFALTAAMMEHIDSDWKDNVRKRPRLRAERAERDKFALADHLDLPYSWGSAKARWRAGARPSTPAGP